MKQINVLSTIFTSALLESSQYGLIINLEWSSLDIEDPVSLGLAVISGKRNDCWKKKTSVAWKIDKLKGSTSLHDGTLLKL